MKFLKRFKAILALALCGLLCSVLFVNCNSSGFEAESLAGTISGDDALLKYAWHLKNTGQRVFATSNAVSGVDLNLTGTWGKGFLGKNIRVLVSDDGLEDSHEDLNENFRYGYSKNFYDSAPYTANSAAPTEPEDNHGTCVAGLIAAVGDNKTGARGVAPLAQLSVANFLSENISQTSAMMASQAEGDFDIFNMSWGTKQNTLGAVQSLYESQLAYGVQNGRAGKGSNFVKAAGNEYLTPCHLNSSATCIGSSNFDSDNTNPYVLMVSAVNSRGVAATYSSIGANIWISSFGGQYGSDTPAMLTTDRTGCGKGYAASSSSSGLSFEKGGSGNTDCKYTATFNGTSAAAPLISGVIALMLEANPSLTWRDVRHILAKTARIVDPSTSMAAHPRGVSLPSGVSWDQGWVTNKAGFAFHNRYGFGLVSVDDAVDMALNYKSNFGTYLNSGWADDKSGLNVSIQDYSSVGGSSSMSVSTGMKIQSVQLKVWITHSDVSELALELTSPSGTKSVVVNMNNSLTSIADYDGQIFLSNAFYQENSQGTWTLKVIDGKAGNTGTLTRWSLNFTGSN